MQQCIISLYRSTTGRPHGGEDEKQQTPTGRETEKGYDGAESVGETSMADGQTKTATREGKTPLG